MRQERLPAGWDEERVQRVLKYYEEQSEDEAVAEEEVAVSRKETKSYERRHSRYGLE